MTQVSPILSIIHNFIYLKSVSQIESTAKASMLDLKKTSFLDIKCSFFYRFAILEFVYPF